jgi:YHS domain-containing protein
MFKYIFIRLILPLLLFLVLRYIFKSVSESLKTASPDEARKVPRSRSGGELKKDPVCGTYVSTEAAVTRTVDNEVLHFCSAACRDQYRA